MMDRGCVAEVSGGGGVGKGGVMSCPGGLEVCVDGLNTNPRAGRDNRRAV